MFLVIKNLGLDGNEGVTPLANTISLLAKEIKEHFKKIPAHTKKKRDTSSDPSIENDILSYILPQVAPPFSDRDDLELSSFMMPAKEISGDFYDFFFTDNSQRKIAFVIADVAGKGEGAALFMLLSKWLIMENKHLPFDEILGKVNNLLAEDNKSSMFVTVFFSVLDLETGVYTYSSAGHNPPVLYRKEHGTFSHLPLPITPPLAVFPNRKFPTRAITLQQGDTLLLYTDGVTETFNKQLEMYGTNRLFENLRHSIDKPTDIIIENLYRSVRGFAEGAPPSDDITMLCFRYLGRGMRNE